MTDFLFDGPAKSGRRLVLAHGSGAPMDSPFMATIAQELGARGLRVARFEFPYMAKRRQDGRQRPPDRGEVLLQSWREALAQLGWQRPAVGGKSLGGRIASYLADEEKVAALVVLGYPYHPPGRPDNARTEHLAALKTRSLFLQGTRDVFGRPQEIEGYTLSPTITLEWVPDGDHGFEPRASSGRTLEQNLRLAAERVAAFLGAPT